MQLVNIQSAPTRQPIEAVDHGRQVNLASCDLELRDVGKPLLIRGCSLKVAVDEIVRGRADFSQIGGFVRMKVALATGDSRRTTWPVQSGQISKNFSSVNKFVFYSQARHYKMTT